MDDPLDFEFEEPMLIAPKKKKPVIGLDDLLADYYEEKSTAVERNAKRAKRKPSYDSDDEDMDEKDAIIAKQFNNQVDEIQKTIGSLSGDEDAFLWGFQVFGDQEVLPEVQVDGIESCELLQLRNLEVNSVVGLKTEKGVTFLEGLLTDEWLLKLVSRHGQLERPVALWTFHLMLYSPNEVLRRSACDFWCGILQHKDEAGNSNVEVKWLPKYHELKRALESYGYRFHPSDRLSTSIEIDLTDSASPGPPQNIRYWIKYVSVCFQARDAWKVLSTSEAEYLTFAVITLFLDRILSGLSMILHECLIAAVSCFKVDEWQASSQKIAKSLALRLPDDVNCLRIVESISGSDERSKHLRSKIAYHFLLRCFDKQSTSKEAGAEEVLELLISTNVKERNSDFYQVYIHLTLAENWVLYDPQLKDKPVIRQMWGLYLRNISCNISSTDMRSHASKVRSKASYLLQGTSLK